MSDTAAKKLFWQYACNHFFIAHDGMHKEYEKLGGGDREKEQAWRSEYIQDRIERLSYNSFDLLHDLRSTNAGEAIPELLKMKEFPDDYSKFWFACQTALQSVPPVSTSKCTTLGGLLS